MLVLEPESTLFKYLKQLTGVPYQEGMRFIGWELDGKLVTVAGFYDYTKTSIFIHLASQNSRALVCVLPFLRDYVFHQLRCKVLFAKIDQTNHRALRLATRLGFTKAAFIEEVYEDTGVIIMKYREAQ